MQICYNNDVMNKNLTSFFCLNYKFILYLILASFLLFPGYSTSEKIKNIKLSGDKNNLAASGELLIKFKNDLKIYKISSAVFFTESERFVNKRNIEYIEPNFNYKITAVPNDTFYANQWYLDKIKALKSWGEKTASDKIIAILDSGVQIDHPDLRNNIWRNNKEIPENNIDDDNNGFIDDINGWDFVNNEPDPNPKFKKDFTEAGVLHGTIVAGIAAASSNNVAGITGVSWSSKIMPLKVLNDSGEGSTGTVVRAIDYAVKNGADVINLSFVGNDFSESLDNAIRRAHDAGIIIVAAAGNEQGEGNGYSLDKSPMYPVCDDGNPGENMVIGVAATDAIDQKASFSSYGFKCVDIAAPGISIFSTVVYSPNKEIEGKLFDKYYDGFWSGTSMATPMVSATIAMMESVNPSLGRNQVVKLLLNSADNINKLNPSYLNQLGRGRLNVYNAVSSAKEDLVNNDARLLLAPLFNLNGRARIADIDGSIINEFDAYKNFSGGVNLASGDVNGDGVAEIITAPNSAGGPHIKIFNLEGKLKGQFFVYDKKFRGGVNIAVCDTGADGRLEIIAAPGPGLAPQVKIFDEKGALKSQFYAYDKKFRGGVNIACGDVDGDSINEIIAAPGKGGGSLVRIFDSKGLVKNQFFVYNPSFRGGLKIAAGNIGSEQKNKKEEIIIAPASGGAPEIKVMDNFGKEYFQFYAYDKNFKGGVNLSVGDFNKDGFDEIITGAGKGGGSHVKIFNYDKSSASSFFAYEKTFRGGVNVGSVIF